MAGKGFARRVTLDTLEEVRPLLRSPDELPAADDDARTSEVSTEEEASDEQAAEREAAEALFNGEAIDVSLNRKRPRGRRQARGRSARKEGASPPGSTDGEAARGPLVWRKRGLPKSDVLQSSAGSNPTGGLRLTQAGFRVGGRLISAQKYFRDTVFSGLSWKDISGKHPQWEAYANFRILILGVREGTHRLRITHKPSGEAGQGNYTTMLHWGDLSKAIRKQSLVGRTLSLYAPAGKDAPYVLEVHD